VRPTEPKRLVVLAGGVGSRLRTKAAAKPLVRLAGAILIERLQPIVRCAKLDAVRP
jgi:choline kinase